MIDCGDNRGKLLSYCQCISCIRVFQYNLFSGIFKNFQISTDDAIHPLYQSCQYPAHSNDDAERHENLFIQPYYLYWREEFKKYESLPSIDRNEDPISWWKTNTTIFPNIKPRVLRFLSAPPSSVASERQFSTAGDIYKETRSRLTVDNADRLIFIMKNKNHM